MEEVKVYWIRLMAPLIYLCSIKKNHMKEFLKRKTAFLIISVPSLHMDRDIIINIVPIIREHGKRGYCDLQRGFISVKSMDNLSPFTICWSISATAGLNKLML